MNTSKNNISTNQKIHPVSMPIIIKVTLNYNKQNLKYTILGKNKILINLVSEAVIKNIILFNKIVTVRQIVKFCCLLIPLVSALSNR